MNEDETEVEFSMTPTNSIEFPYLTDEFNQTSVDWQILVPDSLFKNPSLVYQAIEMKYLDNIKSINKTEILKRITKVMSDLMVVAPVLMEADLYASAGLPVFLYQFDHRHPLFSSNLPDCDSTIEYRDDTQHGLDVALLYQSANVIGIDLDNVNWTSDDIAITNLLSQHVTRYVKTGNPNDLNSDNQKPLWLRYSKVNRVSLYIEAKIQRLVEIDDSLFDFWHETIPIIDRLKDCSF